MSTDALNCGNSPCTNKHYPDDPSDTVVDFEQAFAASMIRSAIKTADLSRREKFRLADCELTGIQEGDRVKFILSTLVEVTLDLEAVEDVDDGLAKLAVTMGHLFSGVE